LITLHIELVEAGEHALESLQSPEQALKIVAL